MTLDEAHPTRSRRTLARDSEGFRPTFARILWPLRSRSRAGGRRTQSETFEDENHLHREGLYPYSTSQRNTKTTDAKSTRGRADRSANHNPEGKPGGSLQVSSRLSPFCRRVTWVYKERPRSSGQRSRPSPFPGPAYGVRPTVPPTVQPTIHTLIRTSDGCRPPRPRRGLRRLAAVHPPAHPSAHPSAHSAPRRRNMTVRDLRRRTPHS